MQTPHGQLLRWRPRHSEETLTVTRRKSKPLTESSQGNPGYSMLTSINMNLSSHISSLGDQFKSTEYIEPHYKEWYRLAIDKLVDEGIPGYKEFLAKEGQGQFLAEEELYFIKENVRKLPPLSINTFEDTTDGSSSGTYWPVQSDTEAPDLDLGWPYVIKGLETKTKIDLHFHPPREDSPTIKEIVRKLIRNARQVIAIVMDVFTDVDIFKEVLDAATRGVPIYIVLDDSNFRHFTAMCENQGVHLQRFMNIRIRTVKGLDYLCRSGCKFHGKMMEKFLLVDCKTVVYGTYSFMWSYEKINLSMVQVISGQLVESYDEEFRTIYARSDIPNMFSVESSRLLPERRKPLILQNGIRHDFYQHSVTSIASSTSRQETFNRANPTRHTLDTLYKKFYRRRNVQQNEWDNISNKSNTRALYGKPLITNNIDTTNRVSRYQACENDYWKRHSYAGEQQETSPYLLLNRSRNTRPLFQRSSHNLLEESESVTSSIRGDARPYSHEKLVDQWNLGRVTPKFERSIVTRNTYHGPKTLNLPRNHKLPTLESMKRAGLQNWRIESYLKDPVASQTSSIIDPYEPITPSTIDRGENSIGHTVQGNSELMGRMEMKATPNLLHSRLRSSLVYKTPFVGEEDTGSHNSESTNSTIGPDSGSTTPQRLSTDRSVHSLTYADEQSSSLNILSEVGLEQRLTAQRSFKRDTELSQISDLHRQHSFRERFQTQLNEQSSMPKLSFNASVSRTLSIPALSHMQGNEALGNKTLDQQSAFIRRSSEKIKSLLNISSEKKDSRLRSRGSDASYQMSGRGDKLTSEDDHQKHTEFSWNERRGQMTDVTSNSTNSPQVTRSNRNVQLNSEVHLPGIDSKHLEDASAPRFSTEELHISEKAANSGPSVHYYSHRKDTRPEESQAKVNTRAQHNPNEQRVYSRFEKLYTTQNNNSKREETVLNPERKHPPSGNQNTSVGNNFQRSSRPFMVQGNRMHQRASHNENKFEKLMQKFVGTFRHKK
ncbi:protein FAM83B isoform X2 [Mobula hypostoma]|uniref:protein FAM83B isoform X2 n=1 Tax=Mobula hypostoma TaxID=723540 RepID=UPI002FC2FC2C